LLSKFALKLNYPSVGNRSQFAVVPVEGFNPERIRSLKIGMETTLGGKILAAAILDRDYRSQLECESIAAECEKFCSKVTIHQCKEIENFVLVPTAIDRAANNKVVDQIARSGNSDDDKFVPFAEQLLEKFAEEKKAYIQAQYLASRRAFERHQLAGLHEATITEASINEFEGLWKNEPARRAMIPGKDALGEINKFLQQRYKINVTATGIIDAMKASEVPKDMGLLLVDIATFSAMTTAAEP
jgi:hypothetical protein